MGYYLYWFEWQRRGWTWRAPIVPSGKLSVDFYEWSIVEDYDDETDNIIMSITPNDFN